MTHLSQSQLGIFYSCQNSGDSKSNYQIPFLYRLPESVDVQRLVKAFDAFAAAHPYINSRIILSDGEPVMKECAYEGVEMLEIADINDPALKLGQETDLLKDKLYRAAIISTPSDKYFFVDFHHIIFDGSSFLSFSKDLSEAYSGKDLEKETADGGKMAEDEFKLRNTDRWQMEKDWYMKEFSAAEDLESTPVPCSEVSDCSGVENCPLSIEPSEVQELCEKFSIKRSTLFTAAWAKTLANYSAEDKAVFSTIYNGRTQNDRRSITMAVRTLPVFSQMPSSKPIGDWMAEVQAQLSETRSRTVFSYSDLHEAMSLRADVLFAYQGRLASAFDFPITLGKDVIVCRDLRKSRPGTIFDGELFEMPDNNFLLRITYDKTRYSASMARGFAESFSALVRSMSKAETIADLSAISQIQEEFLDEMNGHLPETEAVPLLAAFYGQVEKAPDAECCVFEGRRFTYAQIDRITDDLAARIQDITKCGRKVVSFISARSEMMVVLPLAALKAGCTYQPLDSSYPKERLNFMINDADAALLICPSGFRDLVDEYNGEVILLDSLPEGDRKPEETPYDKDDTLLLLYTSGTTGTPKGVMLTNGNVADFVRSNTALLGISSSSRYLSYASYGFDAFMMDVWTTLSNGACIHIISEDIRYDLVAIKEYIEREHITHTFMTTQVGTQLAVNFPEIRYLTTLMVGGEKLVSINPPEYRMINGYGPTETTCYVTAYTLNGKEQNIPIGKATENVHLYIVNKDGKRVPACAAGELWIAGSQVSKGYLNQPEKTAAVFIDNPFEGGEYSRIYRSGDIVRYREDGMIEFVGRKDGQVKIRGFRIELKEVEAVIREYPAVKEVTVQAFDIEAGGKAIVAYVVAEGTLDIEALNNFIVERKPQYMVPAVTMQLDTIPLNVNGKVDRKKLPEPVMRTAAKSDDAPAAPLNHLEQELMTMVGNLTDCKDFPVTLPLAKAGLSSIASLKLSMELFKKYGINISNRDLSHSATVQSIENEILDRLLSNSDAPIAQAALKTGCLEPDSDAYSAPLTNAQTGVYFECLKSENSTVYNIPEVITFPESITPEQLKDAVARVIELHPLLSATFRKGKDGPEIYAPIGAKAIVSISDKSVDELKKDFVQAFNLSEGPLYRALVSGHTLLLDVHHLVFDGSSLSILIHQICSCLEGAEVQPEDCNYFQFSKESDKSDNSSAEAFFKEKLSNVTEGSCLPADLRGNESEGRTASVSIPVDHKAVAEFARVVSITPAAVYLGAFEYLTARYANTREACICTVSSGRGDLRLGDTVGMFVNTLAQTAHIASQSVREYLSEVASDFAGSIEHENFPFARVSDDYGINPDIVFVYEVGVIDRFSVNGVELELESLELPVPKFKFTLLVEESKGSVVLTAQYNDALYSPAMAERFLDSLKQVIANMIGSPDAQVRNISIVSPSQQLELSSMNNVAVAPMPERIVHNGIRHWVETKPEHEAVVANDRNLTYADLDQLANRIANALIAAGVKKGDPVVALLPRRSTTIACIYGIMKAGAAFIPCDPEYPTERIKLIADDSDAPFVVTTAALTGNYLSRGLDIDELCAYPDATDPNIPVSKDDLAYMIYTSGSTGRPKGVRVTHANITTLMNISPESTYWIVVSECERICTVATISFDAFIFDLIIALFHGLTLVFPDEDRTKDPVALTRMLADTKSDYICCTSSRMLQYLELEEFAACVAKMKVFQQGGEKFSEILLDKLRALNENLNITNGYGPTEISISCNASNIRNAKQINVGKPLPNYTEWIIDKDCNELPAGVTGELCVGGEAVTEGYNKLPELTEEKYITYRGMRAFKTGDYARWLPDGTVEILGRTDNQVKLRGLRIELGEVESAISRVQGIRNVLAKICNIKGRDHLSAYFVADRPVDIEYLKFQISSTLTAYMVPTAYLQMDAFPITPNGKVDVRHLPEPELAPTSTQYVTPSNNAEAFFVSCFQDILQLEKVSVLDSFFELGGTSLVVMKLVLTAQQSGYQISYSDVFSHPSPRDLATLVSGASDEKDADPDEDIKNYDYEAIDNLLKENNLASFKADMSLRPMKEVLITGATGFLGIHIFRYLLENYPDLKIHCLLRSHSNTGPESRLSQMMFYYFELHIDKDMGKRIFVHQGDATEDIALDVPIDTVFNCAALVKHFAKGHEIDEINVGTVRKCIDFCLKKNARLIQISTYSVAGTAWNGLPDVEALTESMLYFGQSLNNQYLHSKLLGERLVLESVITRGLDAKIMRVGNLSARSEDGEFQINAASNSFMGRLKIFHMLGVQPFSSFLSQVEFSPIDETAASICLLAGTNSKCVVFHPYNSHVRLFGDVLGRMNVIGKKIDLVEDEIFLEMLDKAKSDENMQSKLSAMLAYDNKPTKELTRVIPANNKYTNQVLVRLGFTWTETSAEYVDCFLKQINGLRFFET